MHSVIQTPAKTRRFSAKEKENGAHSALFRLTLPVGLHVALLSLSVLCITSSIFNLSSRRDVQHKVVYYLQKMQAYGQKRWWKEPLWNVLSHMEDLLTAAFTTVLFFLCWWT